MALVVLLKGASLLSGVRTFCIVINVLHRDQSIGKKSMYQITKHVETLNGGFQSHPSVCLHIDL